MSIRLQTHYLRSQRGLSLIELMVGMTVGLIVVLAVVSTVVTVSAQRKATVSANDAKESGRAALSLIERSGRLAGAGLFYGGQLVCKYLNAYDESVTPPLITNNALFIPVRIQDGGAGSDLVTFLYENSPGGTAVTPMVNDMPNPSAVYPIARQGRFEEGDMGVIGVPGSDQPCTRFQTTSINGGGSCPHADCVNIGHNSGADSVFNPSNAESTWTNAPRYGKETAGGVIGPAVVIRIGNLVNETFAVQCNSLVKYAATVAPAACTPAPLGFDNRVTPLVNDVVMIQAQYGITNASSSDVVTNWVNAIGDWTEANLAAVPARIERIKAIRIVVVSRSAEPANTDITDATCPNGAGVVNIGPCSFRDAQAPLIDLSGTSVPAGRTWRNYRYRVYQSVIPLRNVLWNY